MTIATYSTPLAGLDVVAIDTETTALDATVARVLETAVLVLDADKAPGSPIRFYTNPGIDIPATATAVHGIDGAKVAGAPAFAAIASDLDAALGSHILVGHNIPYDLTVLRAEYQRAGREWRQRRALDIRMLARVLNPSLAHYGLPHLCDWLQLPPPGAKSAAAGVETVVRIYRALLPRLREAGIRTLAEAESAVRALGSAETDAALGLAPDAAASAARPLATIDSYPYRHRVREVMSKPPATLDGTATVREALATLIGRNISSVYVNGAAGHIEGIVTERDLLRALHADPVGGMAVRLADLMSKPLVTISENAFLYRAVGRMSRLKVRHLAVRADDGSIVGAITTRDLLRQRATSAIMLGDELDSATDVRGLSMAWAKLAPMARQLVAESVDARTIAAVISSEICVLTRRAAQMAEARLAADGWGPPPCRYAVLVLGSAGRGESLIAADQDNAIVFEAGEPGGREDLWFEALGKHMADMLDEVGVPYCKGGIMARNPQWRKSLAGWKETIVSWAKRLSPQDLLNVDIFFDGIAVHGDPALGQAVWDFAYEIGHRKPDFVMMLSEGVGKWGAPLTLFGGFKLDEGRVDLKKGGLMPITAGARVLSIRHDARARSTPERLRAVQAKINISASDIDKLVDAHAVILGAMLNQQLIDAENGVSPSPRIDPERLDKDGKAELKQAVQHAQIATQLVSEGRL